MGKSSTARHLLMSPSPRSGSRVGLQFSYPGQGILAPDFFFSQRSCLNCTSFSPSPRTNFPSETLPGANCPQLLLGSLGHSNPSTLIKWRFMERIAMDTEHPCVVDRSPPWVADCGESSLVDSYVGGGGAVSLPCGKGRLGGDSHYC